MPPKRTNMKQMRNQEDSSISQNSTSERCLQNDQIEGLYSAYRRMKTFSEIEETETFVKLEEIIIKYCGRTINFDISPKNVMDILDKRIQRMLKNKKYKKNWSEEDTKILLWTYCKYAFRVGIKNVDETKIDDWIKISELIPGSNADSCMFKVLSLKKVKLSEKKWTQIEENLLSEIVKKSPKRNWRIISQKLFKSNTQTSKIFRNAKQCKEHWVCYLNPDLKKGPWDIEEDKNLMEYVFVNNGVKKWAEIAKIFKGRTQNALKNRFTLIIERMRKEHPNINHEIELIQLFLKKLQSGENSSQSNRRSLSALHRNRIGELENSQGNIEAEIRSSQRVENPRNTGYENRQNYTMMLNPQVLPSGINYYPICFPPLGNYVWVFNNEKN